MSESSHTRFRPFCLAAFAVSAALLVAACGGNNSSGNGLPTDTSAGSLATKPAKSLAGSPAPLASIHKQAGQILDGGKAEFDSRLNGLKGFPAVVNVWASWCGPCLMEFPHFQGAGTKLGKKVAFLGVDSDDDKASAETFLSETPVPYPSYSDPDKEIALSLGTTQGFPTTAFFDRDGNQTYTKIGPYVSQEDLETDIQTYAIGGDTG